jgi:hypothetical protein
MIPDQTTRIRAALRGRRHEGMAAAEVKIRGTVRAEDDHDVQRRYAAAVSAKIGWRPVVGEFTLFVMDVDDVTYIGYDVETSGQHVSR